MRFDFNKVTALLVASALLMIVLVLSNFRFLYQWPLGLLLGIKPNPLGMIYMAVVVLTVITYVIYRWARPAAPKHHIWFVLAAMAVAAICSYILEALLGIINASSFRLLGAWIYASVIFFGMYYLIMRLPDRFRRRAPLFSLLFLCAAFSYASYGVYKILNPICPSSQTSSSQKSTDLRGTIGNVVPGVWHKLFDKSPHFCKNRGKKL